MWDGKLLSALIAAVLLSAVAGRIVAAVYRRRVLALMSQGTPPADAIGDSAIPSPSPTEPMAYVPGTASLTQNRSAHLRLMLAFCALCFAIALFQAWWNLGFVYTEGGYGPGKLLVMTLVFGWMAVPAVGLLRRWSWWRTALASGAYMVAAGALVWARSGPEQQASQVAAWLLSTVAPVLGAQALAASGRARAAGPYLLPLFLLLAGASILGTDLLARVDPGQPWLQTMIAVAGPYTTIATSAALPWLLMAWPAWRGALWLAHAYESGRFSEPVYLLAGYWLVALLINALTASHSVGAASLTVLAGWLAIPAAMLPMRRMLAPAANPPRLLVLRVFRRDAEVQALFDSVIDRWRHSGRTSLIAGTDLALHTLDPDELFAFIGGRLRERFIDGEAELARRLAALDRPPDADGRFRVADFYCFDATWKLALDALVALSDVVLMDLRGFAATNAGCLHELRVLTGARQLRRVVLLHDARTDRAAAQAVVGTGGARFVWIDAAAAGARHTGKILAALLESRP